MPSVMKIVSCIRSLQVVMSFNLFMAIQIKEKLDKNVFSNVFDKKS